MSERIVWKAGMRFRIKGTRGRFEILSIDRNGKVSWAEVDSKVVLRVEYVVDFGQHFERGERFLVDLNTGKDIK